MIDWHRAQTLSELRSQREALRRSLMDPRTPEERAIKLYEDLVALTAFIREKEKAR